MSTLQDEMRSSLEEMRDRALVQEEAERLGLNLYDFIVEAWPSLKPKEPFQTNWHIREICEHLQAVSAGDIDRLQIWIPPGMMKSSCVSVFWHPWEWTTNPWIRYWGASYETRLAGRLSKMSQQVIQSKWYQDRWGDQFSLIRDAEHYWGNDQGGTRLATAPESTGSGEHGHRILIDDPINAKSAEATSKVTLDTVKDWYDGTVVSRGIGSDHARVIIMQRLHEEDLAGHVLNLEDWVVLCLPERYEHDHPYAYRGDPRSEGELLWPSYRTESASNAMAKSLGHRAAGQHQQRPAPREGQIIKRHWWRFYDPKLMDDTVRRPRFHGVVLSIDTPLKDKETSDFVALQAWGMISADSYLIDLRKEKMNYGQCKRGILDMSRHVRKLWPRAAHFVLIENAGYGPELIMDLKREITGVTKIDAAKEGNKEVRAESATDGLESGNFFLPGYREGTDEFSLPDNSRNSAAITDFIESCAIFPAGSHDDDVDAWSQFANWKRSRPIRRGRTASAFRRRERATA